MLSTSGKRELIETGQRKTERETWRAHCWSKQGHRRKKHTLANPNACAPLLPIAATSSAWKSWALLLMLNHFLTKLLDHDSLLFLVVLLPSLIVSQGNTHAAKQTVGCSEMGSLMAGRGQEEVEDNEAGHCLFLYKQRL